jgi:transcriptional regulator with XRE-family HTH domain
MSTFAERLRQLREQKELTRYRLAQLSGVSKEGVNKLERGDADPRLSTLVKLAAALGVSPRDLLPESDPTASRAGKARRRKK